MNFKELRKKFCKDFGLPIHIQEDPYFKYYLKLYDKHFNCVEKYKMFLLDQKNSKKNGEKSFSDLKTFISDEIKETEVFNNFIKDDLKQYDTNISFNKNDIFNDENINKTFVSIDLVKANFSALLFYDNNFFNGYTNYDEFLKSYTNSYRIINSKQFRQVLFGLLEPKKQIKIEKYIISLIFNSLDEKLKENILSINNDEIILSVDEDFDVSVIKKVISQIEELNLISTKVEKFTILKNAKDNRLGYIKKNLDNGEISFKGVPSYYMPQAYKNYFNLEVNENDLVFDHLGELAKYIKPLN